MANGHTHSRAARWSGPRRRARRTRLFLAAGSSSPPVTPPPANRHHHARPPKTRRTCTQCHVRRRTQQAPTFLTRPTSREIHSSSSALPPFIHERSWIHVNLPARLKWFLGSGVFSEAQPICRGASCVDS